MIKKYLSNLWNIVSFCKALDKIEMIIVDKKFDIHIFLYKHIINIVLIIGINGGVIWISRNNKLQQIEG